MRSLLILVISSFLYSVINGQNTERTNISARFDQHMIFDGKLNDSGWQRVSHVSNFIQRELTYGQPCTEKTEVAIVYDKLALYIGVWCYQQDPGGIRAAPRHRNGLG